MPESRIGHASVIQSFKKLVLSVELDGSESTLVNILTLPMYKIPDMMDEDAEYVVDGSDYESEDDDGTDMKVGELDESSVDDDTNIDERDEKSLRTKMGQEINIFY